MSTPLRSWFEAIRAFADEHPEHANKMRRTILNTLAAGALVGMILTVAALGLTGRLC